MELMDMLKYMVEKDASDIYITAHAPPMFRVNGETISWGEKPLTEAESLALTESAMRPDQVKEFHQTFEMNLALSFPELGRFRVNAFRQMGRYGMVIRQIKTTIQTIDELKIPETLKSIIMAKRGLIMVVGGTGSGKSTTLAAMINHRNENSPGHIITIEDPVEFVHAHKKSVVTQREVGMDTFSFKVALKNTLRQAPDVILLGEVRDTETMEMAIEFAETGHLCLCTLHANNANQAIERVMNFFPQERHAQIYMQLSLNMKSIISQRLIRTATGIRVPAVEILLDTPRVKDLIRKGDIGPIKDIMEKGETEGMQTFDGALFRLLKEGLIAYDDALANADSANNLRLRIKLDAGEDITKQKTGPALSI